MSFTLHFDNVTRYAPLAAWIACILVSLSTLYSIVSLPDGIPPARAGEGGMSWQPPTRFDGLDWSVFRSIGGQASVNTGRLARRYRLAGTFVYEEGATSFGKAILDDLQTRQPHIVERGDRLGTVEVVSIAPDRIVLREEGREEELWLSFASSGPDDSGQGSSDLPPGVRPAADDTILQRTRHGARVSETRWLMSKESLMAYVKEIENRPQRIAHVFDSMKPVYDNGKITGYKLGLEGEKEFFSAVGLSEGDIVRSVNTMPMTNRRRAEFWIKQFLQGKLNTVVLGVERNGQVQNMQYLLQ